MEPIIETTADNENLDTFALDVGSGAERREQPAQGRGIIPRTTIETIVRLRDAALDSYGEAECALARASDALLKARRATNAIHHGDDHYNHHLEGEKAEFLRELKNPERADYMEQARKIVDTDAWSYLIRLTDLETLMDRAAKDELRQQLLTDPPEATVDNICATLRQFMLDADTIFRRGIANCFANLDRRFRSHDGFKLGSRIILDRMFNEHGWWNYHRDMEATLLDVERTFLKLDGLSMPASYAGITGRLRSCRGAVHMPRQDVVENEFFKVCVYKNGNAHVWFKRDDLVEKVNKLLAEYYGEVIPDGMTPEDDGGLFHPKTDLAKNCGFFPTPDALADSVVEQVPFYRERNDPVLTVLEPSAGTGQLASRCAAERTGIDRSGDPDVEYAYRAVVDCVDVQPALAQALRAQNLYRSVLACDFLALKPDASRLYDRVVMNPPFDRERDIDHVIHALDFLKPDGFLIAIMSAGTEFRDTRKSIAFRALMQKMNARWHDLPPGSFSSVGTNVNTVLLRVWKDGRSFW